MKTTEKLKLSLKRDDQVQVIAGREKGKIGKVLKVDAKNCRITVEKVNMVKRHMKPTQQNPGGGIVEKETALHYSNVLLYCTKCTRGTRHGIKFVEMTAKPKKGAKKTETATAATSGARTKLRVCKKCGESQDTGK